MRNGIYKDNKRGTWYIHTSVYVDGVPRTITARGYESKNQADRDYDRVIEEAKKKYGVPSRKIFFRDFIEEVIQVRRLNVKLQTIQTDKSVYNKYLLTKYGKSLLADVFNIKEVISWYDSIANDPEIGWKRKNKIITAFRIIVEIAYERDYIEDEQHRQMIRILKNVKPNPLESNKEKIAWTKEEYKRFIEVIPEDTIWYPFFLLYGELGCRIGEIQGLQWKHFDEHNHTISIVQQIAEATGKGHWIIETPKSKASIRTNIISDNLTQLLKEIREGSFGYNDEFIFGKYKPMSKNTIRRALYKFINAAGVRKITPHEIRHSNISWMVGDPSVQTMQDIRMISERVGHSDMSTTLKTYTHVINSRERTVVNSLITSLLDKPKA